MKYKVKKTRICKYLVYSTCIYLSFTRCTQGSALQAMKAYMGSIAIIPVIFNLGTRWSGQLHAPEAFPPPKKKFKGTEKEATQIILKQNNGRSST